jgi:hypothetical protein
MANLKTLIDILETTGNAMVGLESFTYGARSDINANREGGYPCLIVDRNADFTAYNLEKNQNTVSILFQFYGLYHRNDEALDVDQDFQQDLENLAYQYMREIKSKLWDNSRIKIVNQTAVNGSYAFMQANDRLLRLQFNVQFLIAGECNEGIFNYGV